jgi:hypothetical protein
VWIVWFSLLSFVFSLLLVSIIARGCVVCVKSAYACPNLLDLKG